MKLAGSQHLQNVSGSHSHGSLMLRRPEVNPDWFIFLLPWTWLFLQAWEFVGGRKFLMDTGVRTAGVVERIV